jgi:hypothetical protein
MCPAHTGAGATIPATAAHPDAGATQPAASAQPDAGATMIVPRWGPGTTSGPYGRGSNCTAAATSGPSSAASLHPPHFTHQTGNHGVVRVHTMATIRVSLASEAARLRSVLQPIL